MSGDHERFDDSEYTRDFTKPDPPTGHVARLDLGYRRIAVRRVNADVMEGKIGAFYGAASEIWLAHGLSPIEEFHTLVHELIPAIYQSRQIHAEDGEERTVSELAEGLVEAFIRNPYLARRVEWAAEYGGEQGHGRA